MQVLSARLSVFPRSSLLFLHICTKDKVFKAKCHGVSEKERSDTDWETVFLEKQQTRPVFTKHSLRRSGFQMFGQTRVLPSPGRVITWQDLKGRASWAGEAGP